MGALFYWWFLEPGLVLAATYGVVAYVSRKISKQLTVAAKLGWGLLIGYPLWLMLPEWDNVIGKQKFAEICAAEAGIKVYRKVILPKEQIREDGLPIFFPQRLGRLTESHSENHEGKYQFRARYEFSDKYLYGRDQEWLWVPDFSYARIRRDTESLYDAQSKELLGKRVAIVFRAGGAPTGITEGWWLECPKRQPERAFGMILSRAVFEAESAK